MNLKTFTQVKTSFQNAGNSMRCNEAKALLTQLGFNVRDGKRGGHKIFTHARLKDFTSGSLNCDHGKNPEIKKPYLKKIIQILNKYDTELIKLLE